MEKENLEELREVGLLERHTDSNDRRFAHHLDDVRQLWRNCRQLYIIVRKRFRSMCWVQAGD